MEAAKPFLIPILSFVLGLLAAPLVDYIKSHNHIQKIRKAIEAELKDELNNLTECIREFDKNIKIRESREKEFKHLSIPAILNLILIPKYLDDIFINLSPAQRKAYKTLIILQKDIEGHAKIIEENYSTDNHKCLESERSANFSMLSSYYLINNLLVSKDNYITPHLNGYQIVMDAAKSLNVSYPLEKRL